MSPHDETTRRLHLGASYCVGMDQTSRRALLTFVPAALMLTACGTTKRTGMITDKDVSFRRVRRSGRDRYTSVHYAWVDRRRCQVSRLTYNRVTIGQRATVECR